MGVAVVGSLVGPRVVGAVGAPVVGAAVLEHSTAPEPRKMHAMVGDEHLGAVGRCILPTTAHRPIPPYVGESLLVFVGLLLSKLFGSSPAEFAPSTARS